MIPWIHSHVWPTGDVYPCCMVPWERPVGNLRDKSLYEIWNGPEMRELRVNMLADKPSDSCRRCYELEDAGSTTTLRKEVNRKFAHHWERVASTQPDGTVSELRWPYFDVRFSNLCNFRCRSCGPQLSSGWSQDHIALYGGAPEPAVLHPTGDPEVFWKQIEPLIPFVEEIYFAGGEPLIMEEHYRILEILIELRKFDVYIKYNTNFSRFKYKSLELMKIWDRFKRVTVGASLDASHQRGEYLRKGQIWSEVVENRKRMLEICPRVEFHVSATVSAFNILHLPDFHREWTEARLIGINDFNLNLLTTPEYLRVQILPAVLKDLAREKITNHIDGFIRPAEPDGAGVRTGFEACIQFMDEQDLVHELSRFKQVTRALDTLRKENVRDVFPELGAIFA